MDDQFTVAVRRKIQSFNETREEGGLLPDVIALVHPPGQMYGRSIEYNPALILPEIIDKMASSAVRTLLAIETPPLYISAQMIFSYSESFPFGKYIFCITVPR